MFKAAKKLVLVSTTSTLVTSTREEALECVPYIHYLVQFKKNINRAQVQALIDLGSEVNAINLTFTKQLGLPIQPTDIGAQNIDSIMLDTYKMVVTAFSVVDKANRVRFFEETFLVANVRPEVVFGLPFLTLSDVDVDFSGRELW